jgi:hypothetical protein
MSTLYQIYIRDTSGARIATFAGGGRGLGGMLSFNYTKLLRYAGQWTVRLDAYNERISEVELNPATGANADYIFEFWRKDYYETAYGVVADTGWYRDFAGFHRFDQFNQEQEGRDVYIARGRGVNDLLSSEIIAWDAGTSQTSKDGPAETVAKEFVDENVGPGATVAAGRRWEGAITGLSVEADAATGDNWVGGRVNKNLLDVIDEIADIGPGDFMLQLTSDANDPITLEFQWADEYWGLDRTEGNGVNVPVIWDDSLGNIESVRYAYSRLDEINTASIGGPGSGTSRAYTEVTTGGESDSPYARRAIFRKGSDADTVAKRQARGNALLERGQPKRRLTFSAKQTAAVRYGTTWDVGDLVTVKFRDNTFSQQIVGVRVGISGTGEESVEPILEDL